MPSVLLYRLSSISSLSATIALLAPPNVLDKGHHTNETEAPPDSRIDTISFKE